MTRLLLVAALGTGVLFSGALAQENRPIHPATPAFDPSRQAQQPKVEKPKLYDESADARQQIAAALARAKKENRRVLIQWGGNWCGWCIKLHELCTKDQPLRTKLQYEYDVVHIDAGRDGKNMDLAKSYGAACDKEGFPYLTILDAEGKPLVNQGTPAFEVDGKSLAAGHDPKKLLDFLTKHQAPYRSASTILEEGLAEAKKSGKRVFLHFGAPWCVWCHRLEDWMARSEIAPILAREFVDVKIDVDRTIGGKEMNTKYAGPESGGIPWFVILDENGKALADSNGPEGNVGFPYQPGEVAHFEQMLSRTARQLTTREIETLAASLHANREEQEKKRQGR